MHFLVAMLLMAEPDLAPVLESLEAVYDTAREIDMYVIEHDRLPEKAKDRVDGWGTPLLVEFDRAKNEYVIASAGSDKKFNRAEWSQRAETQNDATDIVLRNHERVRWPETWATARVKAAAGDIDTSAAATLERSRAHRTIVDMMVIKVAIETYADEHGGALPNATSVDALAPLLEPNYLKTMPRKDAWGSTFGVQINDTAKMYRLVASGADMKFDITRWSEKTTTRDYKRDLVLLNGNFVGPWEASEIPGNAGQALASMNGAKRMYEAWQSTSDADRLRYRLEGLKWDVEDANRAGDLLSAIGYYEEYERKDPSFRDFSLLSLLEFAVTFPPPKSLGRPRAVDDPKQLAAIPRIEAALQRFVQAEPENRNAVLSLAKLTTVRDAKAGRALLTSYIETHPNDLELWFELVHLSMQAKDWNGAAGDFDAIVSKLAKSDDAAALNNAASLGTRLLTMIPDDGLQTSQWKKLAQQSVALARHGLAATPDDALAMMTLGTALLRQASYETDAAKKKKLKEESERISTKGRELIRSRQ